MLNLWMTKLKQEILSHRKESPVQFSLYLMNSIPCKHVNSLRDGPHASLRFRNCFPDRVAYMRLAHRAHHTVAFQCGLDHLIFFLVIFLCSLLYSAGYKN